METGDRGKCDPRPGVVKPITLYPDLRTTDSIPMSFDIHIHFESQILAFFDKAMQRIRGRL